MEHVSDEPGAPNAKGFITDPRDTDVLCGRGGAALRHPGNQTYRKLVNLNKGLYITCLKTEKLKISRSIVAAIREQKGRFLEKNNKESAWFDIGDKKAVEKTSQALREGQPKLRQRMAEMGGTGTNQYDINGTANIDHFNQQDNMRPPPNMQSQLQQQQQMQQQRQIMRQQELLQQQRIGQDPGALDRQGIRQDSNHSQGSGHLSHQQDVQSLQPPSPLSTGANPGNRHHDLHADMLNRLSLQDMQGISSGSGHSQLGSMSSQIGSSNLSHMGSNHSGMMGSTHSGLMGSSHGGGNRGSLPGGSSHSALQQQQQQQQQMAHQAHLERRHNLRPSLNARASLARDLGIAESQLSLMSDFSAFGGSIAGNSGRGFGQGLSSTSNHLVVSATAGLATSINESSQGMSVDSSFKQQLMGLPLGSIHTMGSDQFSVDNSMSTGGSITNPANNRYSNSSAGHHGGAANDGKKNTNFDNLDRRRVFASLKYARHPSTRTNSTTPSTTTTASSTSTARPQSVPTKNGPTVAALTPQALQSYNDEMSGPYMFESVGNISMQSANTIGGASTLESRDPTNGSATSHNNFNHQRPGAGGAPGVQPVSKVQVETAKVIDHSSVSRSSLFSDVLGSGSKHSIMSGLSRISDTSIDHSIFSNLSKQIGNVSTGNVSTRSMAMSEISTFEIQERDSENEEIDPTDFTDTPRPAMDFEL